MYKRQLLKAFGSVKNIEAAPLDELKAAKGVPAGVAEAVFAYFHPEKTK